jgi:hypothetical protein
MSTLAHALSVGEAAAPGHRRPGRPALGGRQRIDAQRNGEVECCRRRAAWAYKGLSGTAPSPPRFCPASSMSAGR